MERCVIIGGADIADYAVTRSHLRPGDFIICCDSGLRHRDGLGIAPDLIVGDFDSHADPELPIETIVLPREKDDTDTFFAVKEAFSRGYRDFLLLGVIGGRLDHTLANVSILLWLDSHGASAMAVDDHSELEIVSRQTVQIPDRFAYFSLLNITGVARGVTIRQAKYPLEGGEIFCDYQYAVSNEPLPGQTAEVSLTEGRLLLVKDRAQ